MWAILTPENLLHERLEFREGDSAWCRRLNLLQHSLELFVGQVLALSTEALFEVCFSDEARIIDVKMMEGKSQVGRSDGLLAIDSDCEELRIVNLSIMVEVNSFEDLTDLFLVHVQLTEGCPDFAELQCSRVIRVKSTERIFQKLKVECASVRLVDEEGECLNLEGFGLAEVFDTAQNLQLLGVKECWVMTCVVRLDIVGGEPWVLKALLGCDPCRRVL